MQTPVSFSSAGTVGVGAVEASEIKPGDTAVVIGAGKIGLVEIVTLIVDCIIYDDQCLYFFHLSGFFNNLKSIPLTLDVFVA